MNTSALVAMFSTISLLFGISGLLGAASIVFRHARKVETGKFQNDAITALQAQITAILAEVARLTSENQKQAATIERMQDEAVSLREENKRQAFYMEKMQEALLEQGIHFTLSGHMVRLREDEVVKPVKIKEATKVNG